MVKKDFGVDFDKDITQLQKVGFTIITNNTEENKNSEPQMYVMFQALAYATFVACLLRSDKGKEWWQILRNSDVAVDVPEDLHIDAVTLMPKGNSQEGSLTPIKIDNFVTLHPYTLYYELNKDETVIKDFTGTLKDDLKV